MGHFLEYMTPAIIPNTHTHTKSNMDAQYRVAVKKTKFAERFQKLQFGVSKKNGMETVIHTAREAYNKGATIMGVDFKNAFNMVDRNAIREELVVHFPHLLDYFDFAYGKGSPLFFAGELLTTSNRE